MPDDPATELELAYGALADADVLRHQGTERGVVSRLYYACFHAAQAVLYDRGFEPETHGAVIQWFGREVVVPGDATGADGRFLRQLYAKRQDADYQQDDLMVNVNSLYSRTERFVEYMTKLLDEEPSEFAHETDAEGETTESTDE